MKKILCLFLAIILSPSLSFATDINADSCSRADVGTAVTAASNGDTVIVPAGSCVWTSALAIGSKAITLKGTGTTIIRDDIGNAALISFTQHATVATRITGFAFKDQSSSFAGYSSTFISFAGSPTSAQSRIDNNTFTVESPYCGYVKKHINATGQGNGVIDNNTFYFSTASEVIHNEGYGTGDNTGWTYTVTPGSDDALYVENNTFINEPTCYWLSGGKIYAGANSAIQNYYGARTVFRYNSIYHANVDVHGTAGMVGGRWFEFYNNNFYGVDAYLGNTGSIDKLFQIRAGSGVIFSNTYTQNGNACNTGAKMYEEDTGTYPLAYQPGRGQLTGGSFALDPVRIWNNTFTGCTNATGGDSPDVVLDRDYYVSTDNSAARTNYTAYDYPHPLAATGPDTTPNAFSFTDITGSTVSTEKTTDPCITVAGIDAGQTPAISISGTGCTYNVDGGAYGSGASTVGLDNVVCQRGTSSASYSTVYPSCTLTIGGVTDSGAPWTVTTQAAVEDVVPPNPPRMRAVTISGSWR